MEGACEASLACTTCHVYVKDDYLDKIPEAEEKEEDLLDLAPFLKPNSRLGILILAVIIEKRNFTILFFRLSNYFDQGVRRFGTTTATNYSKLLC